MPAPTAHQVAQTCAGLAYCVLPSLFFERPEMAVSRLEEDPRKTILLAYFAACQRCGFEPSRLAASHLKVHRVTLGDQLKAFIVEYPSPSAVSSDNPPTPSSAFPHFSAIICDECRSSIEVYVLGQLPFGGTTLRLVTPMQSKGLGPGCRPDLGDFTDLLRERVAPALC